LKLVTAIRARPEMTDVLLADVLGSLGRNQVIMTLVTRCAENSTVVTHFGDHCILPFFFVFSFESIKAVRIALVKSDVYCIAPIGGVRPINRSASGFSTPFISAGYVKKPDLFRM